MSKEIKKAIKTAWIMWHTGTPKHLIPCPTITFEYGFEAGVEYEKKRAAECKTERPKK